MDLIIKFTIEEKTGLGCGKWKQFLKGGFLDGNFGIMFQNKVNDNIDSFI